MSELMRKKSEKGLPEASAMQVLRDDIVPMIKTMEKAQWEDFLWFGYKATGTPVKAGELIFFGSGIDAKQFASDKIKMGESFQILSLEATVEVIKEQAFAQGKQGDELSSVVLNISDIKRIQEQLNFYHSTF